jgi:lysophospholipase L1-like esterase
MSEPVIRPSQRILFAVLTPLITVVILFLLLEIGLRIAGYDPLKPFRQDDGTHQFYLRKSDDPHLRFELNPGFKGKIHIYQDDIDIRINSAGWRGPEIDLPKGGRFRVALLGDSVTFAKEFDEDKTFAGRLERKLREVRPDTDVLNLGVIGYDTLEEVIHFERVARLYKPDVAVVCFCLNDIANSPVIGSARWAVLRPRLPITMKSRALLWLNRMISRAFVQKRLMKEIKEAGAFEALDDSMYGPITPDAFEREQFARIDEMQAEFDRFNGDKHGAVVSPGGKLWLNYYKIPKNLGKIDYSFRWLAADAQKDGIRVFVAVIPFFYRVDGRYLESPAHTMINHMAELNGFQVIDLLSDMSPLNLETLTKDGVHLNDPGHERMARSLFEAIRPLASKPAGSQASAR